MTTHQRHLLYSKTFLYGLKLVSLFFFFFGWLHPQEARELEKGQEATRYRAQDKKQDMQTESPMEPGKYRDRPSVIRQSHQLGLKKWTQKLTSL